MTDKSNDFQLVNYRLALVVGILFGFIGLMAELWGMAIFGGILLIIGLVNKRNWGKEKQWSELSPTARKGQVLALVATAVVGLALIVASVVVSS